MSKGEAAWRCQRDGACCETGEVVMTREERAEIERAAPPAAVLSWAPDDGSPFARLLGSPCPLLARDAAGQASCTVYAVRPYNCRRYMCGRTDFSHPIAPRDAVPLQVLRSRDLRRQYGLNERKAQRWGRAHGWRDA